MERGIIISYCMIFNCTSLGRLICVYQYIIENFRKNKICVINSENVDFIDLYEQMVLLRQ